MPMPRRRITSIIVVPRRVVVSAIVVEAAVAVMTMVVVIVPMTTGRTEQNAKDKNQLEHKNSG